MRRPSLSAPRAIAMMGAIAGLAVVAAPVQAARPAIIGQEVWGWVVSRQPTAAESIPGPGDQGNSADGLNSVRRVSTGVYTVRFGSIASVNVIHHVSALGPEPRLCIVGDHDNSSGDHVVAVGCFDASGAFADSRFVLNVLAQFTLRDDLGYVRADDPSNPGYEPEVQYNSAENVNSVDRIGVGRWNVTFPGLGGPVVADGSAIVTTAEGSPVACRVTGWSPRLIASVVCRDAAGALVDAAFTLTYMKDRGLKFEGETETAYLVADRPKAALYSPEAAFHHSTAGGTPVIARTATGVYVVTLPAIPLGGAAQVSPYGGGSKRCVVGGIRRRGLPQRITIRCFRADGSAPADARFTLAYTQ